jgi:hypothetical protein
VRGATRVAFPAKMYSPSPMDARMIHHAFPQNCAGAR